MKWKSANLILTTMVKEPLNFKHNACRIDLRVAGGESEASGFVYRTKPSCDYDYVLTVKHAFQEGNGTPNLKKISNLTIRSGSCCERAIDLYGKLEDSLLFPDDYDIAVIRVKKHCYSGLSRIAVKNSIELNDNSVVRAHAYITLHRKESTLLECVLKDKESKTVKLDGVKEIENYRGASGSGVYCSEEPYLIGLLIEYRLPHFEQNELCIVSPDWGKVNELLHSRKWSRLNTGNAHLTSITEEKDVIDVRDLDVNGAYLNLEIALKQLAYDLEDDWYFDPLHYVDMCNVEFVLDYFSRRGNRQNYRPCKMEVFYLPKKSFVLRKAMVGTFMDRLLYMAVVCQLGPLLDKHLSRFVYSARYNSDTRKSGLIVQGVEQWTKMNYLISDWISSEDKGCLVKLDLLNYYDTINKTILVRLLYEIVQTENDKACVRLLDKLLQGFADAENNHGIPQNSDASSLLATFYVSHIDEFILSKARHYCRFMDDMYFIAEDIYQARDLLQAIEKHLRQIDLSLNAQKIEFVRLDEIEKKRDFLDGLSLYDHKKSLIRCLIRSSSLGKRMNAIALLMEQMKIALSSVDDSEHRKDENSQKDRALKFSVSAFSSLHLKLDSYWADFYTKLEKLAIRQVDAPDETPLICRLISSIGGWRDISEIKRAIKDLLLRKTGSVYEWQAYHLWMLMAFLRYADPELVKYAVDEIEKNDETKRVEVAAIIIYIVTVNPEYARIILHKLRDKQLHGNLQYRCALIAMRSLDNNVIDEELSNSIENEALCMSHIYLNKQKDKPLVFFHKISSFMMEHNESLFPEEFYSGL